MSKINKSLVERIADLESNKDKGVKIHVSDPNLQLFTDDQWRYKAYAWYCLKHIFIKGIAIIASALPLIAGFVEVIHNVLG